MLSTRRKTRNRSRRERYYHVIHEMRDRERRQSIHPRPRRRREEDCDYTRPTWRLEEF